MAGCKQELYVPELPKWKQHGWREEKAYQPNVLIGNWYENRMKFKLDQDKPRISTHRTDFKRYSDEVKPDCILKRTSRIRDEGLDKRYFTYHHHGYENELITWYDERFGNKPRPQSQQLPKLRKWNGHTLTWLPERNDYPIRDGPCTNFGLLEKKQKDWSEGNLPQNCSTYRSAYNKAPEELAAARVAHRPALKKCISTSVDPSNLVTRDLKLRDLTLQRQPEYVEPPRRLVSPLSTRF